MAKLADAADLKSAGLNRPWGFKSPSGHHRFRFRIATIALRLAKVKNRDAYVVPHGAILLKIEHLLEGQIAGK
jgi:hypothetical protein